MLEKMIEKVVNRKNMLRAYQQVMSNQGSAGVDGMSVKELSDHLHKNRDKIKNFFDEVDHCILLQLLYRKVKCPLTLRLIRKCLRAPILINGKLTKRRKGVPGTVV